MSDLVRTNRTRHVLFLGVILCNPVVELGLQDGQFAIAQRRQLPKDVLLQNAATIANGNKFRPLAVQVPGFGAARDGILDLLLVVRLPGLIEADELLRAVDHLLDVEVGLHEELDDVLELL